MFLSNFKIFMKKCGPQKWRKIGEFKFEGKPFKPVIYLNEEAFTVCHILCEGYSLKQISHSLVSEDRNFVDPIHSMKSITLLNESFPIHTALTNSILGSFTIATFHNFDTGSRGSTINFEDLKPEVRIFASLQEKTMDSKFIDNSDGVLVSFSEQFIYFWDLHQGVCLRKLKLKSNYENSVIRMLFCDEKLLLLYGLKEDQSSDEITSFNLSDLETEDDELFERKISSYHIPKLAGNIPPSLMSISIFKEQLQLNLGTKIMKFNITNGIFIHSETIKSFGYIAEL